MPIAVKQSIHTTQPNEAGSGTGVTAALIAPAPKWSCHSEIFSSFGTRCHGRKSLPSPVMAHVEKATAEIKNNPKAATHWQLRMQWNEGVVQRFEWSSLVDDLFKDGQSIKSNFHSQLVRSLVDLSPPILPCSSRQCHRSNRFPLLRSLNHEGRNQDMIAQ